MPSVLTKKHYKKMKTVFSPSELPHIWANQKQDEGKTSGRNFYFNKRTIYSYGSHFPIAEIIEHKPELVFFTTRGYSNTTAKHINAVRQSVYGLKEIVYVHNPADVKLYNETFWKNIEHFYIDAINFLKESELPRKRAKTILELKNKAIAELTNIETFIAVFDLTIDNLKHKETSYNKVFEKTEFNAMVNAVKNKEQIIADASEVLKNNRVAIEKAQKETDARIKKAKIQAIKDAEKLLQFWLTDSVDEKGRKVDSYRLSDLPQIYLRAIPKTDSVQVETSMGARVDIKKAKVLYKAIKQGKNVLGFDIDGYTVVENTELHLKVGCHILLKTEINRFAETQNW